MESSTSSSPQDQGGSESSSSNDSRQLEALDTSSSGSLSQSASPELDSPTIQAENALVDRLYVTLQTHTQTYDQLHDRQQSLSSSQRRFQRERDAVGNQLRMLQVEEVRQGLQNRFNMWQGWLDETTRELATVEAQEIAAKALKEATWRLYRRAVRHKWLVIRERNWEKNEEAMN